jgi:hypothetical protein
MLEKNWDKSCTRENGKSDILLGDGCTAPDVTKTLLDVWSDRDYAWMGFLVDFETTPPVTGKLRSRFGL